ncbi:TolC family protein [Flavobacterium sp. H122]|uniref:TolC family protein n=1 Tax=Flavobacterium sp. H122 TaxID=2529860 RepID=UPI00145B8AFA|nr:TolC family protein [Flavobacterium sp. H122]
MSGFSQEVTHVTLEEVLQQVETNYPSILQYQENIKSWQAKAEASTAWMPPTFSTGFMQFPYDLAMLKEKNDPMNQAAVNFSVEQMIVNPGKLNAKKAYFNSLSEIEKSNSEWTKNKLRKEAKVLYYTRYVNEKKKTILSESEEILEILLKTAEARFSNNQSKLQTIYKGKARLAELNNMQYMLSGTIAESNIGLNILMVRDVMAPFQIDSVVKIKKYDLNPVNSSTISKRSDIAAIAKSIESMNLEQKIMKTGKKPDFGIRAEHMQMFGMPNQWSLMGMITIPIVPWSSKMYTSEAKAIDFKVQSMEFEKRNMQLMAQRMIAEKQIMLQYEYGQYENYKSKIVPAFENNLQANLLAYRQNTGDFFILLDAWEMVLMKKMEMYDKLFTILNLEAEYEYENETK